MSIRTLAASLCESAAAEGRNILLEPELYALLREGGVPVPSFATVSPDEQSISGFDGGGIPGSRVVIKVVSPGITHKTEMGGVRVVDNDPESVRQACRGIVATVRERGGDALAATIRCLMVCEKVPVGSDLSSQLFAGMRFSADVGPMLAFGFGGLEAEELAVRFREGQGMVLCSPVLSSPEEMLARFRKSFVYRKLAGLTRGGARQIDDAELLKAFSFFRELATGFSNNPETGWLVKDFEINPFFVSEGRLVAVDAFMRFSQEIVAERTCDVEKVHTLLNPRTVAIMGASSKGRNPGRIILNNLLRECFPVENIRVIRPDREPVDGVAACASISELPWRADMIVVAVAAKFVPGIIRETIEHEKAASMVLIPGGMGETEDGKETEREIRALIRDARAAGRFVPVFVGPNCLGIRSLPGRYDTLFIPEAKLPLPERPEGVEVAESALISQSGAFMITRMNNLPFLEPRYAVSTGNQMDLGLVDFVEAVLDEGKVEVFGLYIEGFSPLDGLRLAKLIREGNTRGRHFVVYKAGRTSEGRTATSSHTASISGDYPSCYQVLADAGALMTSTLAEFNDLFCMAAAFKNKTVSGTRLGCISNAGYETVGMADNVSEHPKFSLGSYDESTAVRIRRILESNRLGELVNLRNPLDITPMASDRVYAEGLAAQADCPDIDACVMGIIPLSVMMKSLPPGADPTGCDDLNAPDALPALVPAIVHSSSKPIITTVDCGRLYDPLVDALRKKGVICFDCVDSAMQSLQRYMAFRLGID